MRKIIISAASAVSFLTPLVLAAQAPPQPTIAPFTNLLAQAQAFVNAAIPFVFALAFLFFLWGVALFIFSAGNEDAKDKGKRVMIWGIVALFVMVAVWGLVNVIAGLTGIRYDQAPAQPTPPGGA